MDVIVFRTKKDKSNNIYYIIIEVANKIVKSGYNMGPLYYAEAVEVTRPGLRALYSKLRSAGYTILYV